MAIGFDSSSSINCSDEILGYKSLPLCRFCLIKDGALRFCHIMREEEATRNLVRMIINRWLKFLYASLNLGHCNSSD